jgi:formylmethanofuran dehydrogenase subunit C
MRRISIAPLKLDKIPVEAECISPDKFAGLALDDIRALAVWHGNQKKRIADLFTVSGDDEGKAVEETCILLEGDFSTVKRIGEAMTAGQIEVKGDAGMHAGNGMRGGTLRIDGNAGDWLGREMRGGSILALGNAGNYAGAGYRGERCGMRAGEIEIRGSAGLYLGEHMCGGEITVGGNAGDFPGVAMRGGTITIGGDTYLPGAEMVKGKIVVHGKARLLASYQQLETVDLEERSFAKFVGDLVENGKGEIYLGLQ